MINKINTSPFRYHPEDQFKILRNNSYSFRLNAGDKRILDAVHRSVAVTPLLLLGQLTALGDTVSDQNLRMNLERLFTKGFLNKTVLKDPDSITPPQTIYSLSKAYLRSLAEYPEKLDLLLCKRLLAAQQYLCTAGIYRSGATITMNTLITEKDVKPGFYSDHQFRCDALIQGQNDQTAFVLAVRKTRNWMQDLKDQLATMERTIFSPRALTVQTKDSNVVLIFEDDAHQAEAEQALLQDETCRYEFPVSVTNDIQTFGCSLFHQTKLIPDLKKGLAQQVSGRLVTCIETAFKL